MANVSSVIRIVFLAMIVLIFLLLSILRFETKRYSFDGWKDMQESGLIDKGWIPTILPQSCRSIRLAYNLDSNSIWMRFVANRQDQTSLKEKISRLSRDECGELSIRSPVAPWWSSKLKKLDFTLCSEIEVYRHTQANRRIARDCLFFFGGSDDDVFYWCPGQ